MDSAHHSVGGIYLAINNLPRNIRYQKSNMILVGLIPGPSEPQLSNMNHFLRPVVDELLTLFESVNIPTFSSPSVRVPVRGALV